MNRRPIATSKRSWLLGELALWRSDGVVSDEQSGRIIDLYETPDESARRNAAVAIFALCSIAVLMVGLAALLVVGYNWQDMTAAVKLAVLFGSLAIGQAAAFWLRFRQRWRFTSEVVFFLTGLLYGAMIWLIAQIFNIQAHYPDGLWFWALGILPFALCLDTLLLHALYVVLLAIWVGAEVLGFPAFRPLFFSAWPLAPNSAYTLPLLALPGLLWAYRKQSPWAIGLYVPLLAWWAVVQPLAWHAENSIVFFVGGAGAILLLVAQAHAAGNPLAVAYRIWGLLLTAGALIPLTFADFFTDLLHAPGYCPELGLLPYRLPVAGLPLLLCLVGAVAVLFVVWVQRRTAETAVGRASWGAILQRQWLPIALIVLFAGLSCWTAAFRETHDYRNWYAFAEGAKWTFPVLAPTLLCNAAMVVFALWMMRQGLRRERGLLFAAGILYFLLWSMLRYFDLFADVGGMLGAALMFLLCGVVLFAVARFWHRRKETVHV